MALNENQIKVLFGYVIYGLSELGGKEVINPEFYDKHINKKEPFPKKILDDFGSHVNQAIEMNREWEKLRDAGLDNKLEKWD